MNNKPPGSRPRTTINTRTDMWGIIKPSTVQQWAPPDTRPTTNHAGYTGHGNTRSGLTPTNSNAG